MTASAKYSARSVASSETVEYEMPVGFSVIWKVKRNWEASINQLPRLTHGWPLIVGTISVLMSQGSPRQSRMSKIFDPMELLRPIEPCPCAVTMTDETASGTDVPAARNVKPMTVSKILLLFIVLTRKHHLMTSLTNIGCHEYYEV